MRRFLIAERDVLCSKMMPNGKGLDGLNDTHSLRQIPALSGDGGVKKYEIPHQGIEELYIHRIRP